MMDKLKNMFNKTKGNNKKELTHRELMEQEKKAATKAKKPWVAVLDTHVNQNDIKNGFFELDWNNEFIEQLLDAGYKGESNEQIVDAWFKDIARNVLSEGGYDPNRGAGHINIVPREDGKSEAS